MVSGIQARRICPEVCKALAEATSALLVVVVKPNHQELGDVPKNQEKCGKQGRS